MKKNDNRVFGNSEHPQFPDLIKAGLKVGDKVYSYMYGDGVVARFTKNKSLPLSVAIKGVELLFMADGRRTTFNNIPSIHLQPWNPIAGEPFPFPKWEPIVGEKYGFWGNGALKHCLAYATFAGKLADKFVIQESDLLFTHCAPISEALHILGFDKVGEEKQ
jgi:hypothetical protein